MASLPGGTVTFLFTDIEPDGEVEIFGSRVTRYALGKRPAL